jgi:hypothetical protein
MTPFFRIAFLLTTAVALVACSESIPTAPSAVDPTLLSTTTPVPAPVSQTLTGTWTGAGQTFTVTQIGSSATGMIAPATTNLGNGVTLTESTMITGTVAGLGVTLQLNDRINITGMGATINCTVGHTFTGRLAGNTLSGTMAAGTTPLECGNDSPTFAVPEINGPVVYMRH